MADGIEIGCDANTEEILERDTNEIERLVRRVGAVNV